MPAVHAITRVTLHVFCRTFGAKCAKCGRSVGAGDWVRRARERVYHLACFACDACSRQLSTGEQFALLDARLLCKAHYLDVVEGNNTSSDGENVARTCHCVVPRNIYVKINILTRMIYEISKNMYNI